MLESQRMNRIYVQHGRTLVMPEEHKQEVVKNTIEMQTMVFRSEDLFKGSRQVLISHGSETYRLLHTKNGKLILQK